LGSDICARRREPARDGGFIGLPAASVKETLTCHNCAFGWRQKSRFWPLLTPVFRILSDTIWSRKRRRIILNGRSFRRSAE
jgi:hypothetical protein